MSVFVATQPKKVGYFWLAGEKKLLEGERTALSVVYRLLENIMLKRNFSFKY